MLEIYDRFSESPELKLVSFTVDPDRDSVLHLRNYANNLGVDGVDRWWFLTGDQFELYEIADDYFSIAYKDESSPGGFNHSGRILLVDENGRIRAYADGTSDEDVAHFMQDVANYLDRPRDGEQ